MKSSVRILLTGSSGFLGQHLLKALLTLPDDSFTVQALYRSVEGFEGAVENFSNEFSVPVHTERLDHTHQEKVDEWIGRQQHSTIDICIHTAALSSPRDCEEKPQEAERINNPTYFFDALHKHNPKMRMIALSTDQVYAGDQPPYTETDEARPCNVYGETKLALEESLTSRFSSAMILLRSSIILGPKAPILPGCAHTTFLHFIASREGVDTTFFTDERRSVVAVDDVVASVLWFVMATDTEETVVVPGIYNMGGPDSWSRMELAQAVFGHLHYDPKHLIAAKKADQQLGPVQSPLDISMSSSKLLESTGLTFRRLPEVLKDTF
jgi:dTDP-4-dehydrorhamnose reductase